jgi:putative flippase GtrA
MSYSTSPSSSASDPLPVKQALHEKPGVRQFVKFAIVGLSSTVINFGISYFLQYQMHFPLVPSLTIAFLLSCLNGFIWNRQWTFRHHRSNSAATQSLRFVAVNIVGFVLNTSIAVFIVALYESGKGGVIQLGTLLKIFAAVVTSQHREEYPKLVFFAALAMATAVVVFWNFFANRYWTFRHKKTA